MQLIGGISSDANQKQKVTLPSGKTFSMTLVFRPMQLGWFIDISYESFTLNGLRVCTSPNMLRQYKNLIPFGMACFVDDNLEPMLQQDFSSDRAKLYLLSLSEVQDFEDLLSG